MPSLKELQVFFENPFGVGQLRSARSRRDGGGDETRAPEPSGFCRSDFGMERIGTHLETGIRRPADRSSQGR